MNTVNAYGKQINTKFDFELVSDEFMSEVTTEFFKLPEKSDVDNCILRLVDLNQLNIKPITYYYFRWLMNECIRHDCKFSVNQAMSNKEIFSFIYSIIKRRENYFFFTQGDDRSTKSICEALRQYFAMGGAGIAGSVAQFPYQTVKYILEKYNVNNNYYDFSCGWGCRLTGALCENINYYGTDPNYKLVDKLNEYADDWKKIVTSNTSLVDIHCCGSENFIPELEHKIGLAFSSTPYFKLENYIYGNQSCNMDSYDEWREFYLKPTIENIYKYLIDDGFFIINIKNYQDYDMEHDSVKIAEEVGFELSCVEDLYLDKNMVRMVGTSDSKTISISEPMFVFKKGNPKIKQKSLLW